LEIREILNSLIKETNRVLTALGRILYKPMNNIFLSYLNILKASSNVFNKIADFGIYIFTPYLRAIPPIVVEEGAEAKPLPSQLIKPSSILQPHISYSLELIKKLQPTRIRDRTEAGVKASSITPYPLTTFYNDFAALTTPLTLATSKMVESRLHIPKAQQVVTREGIVAQEEVTPSVKTVSDSFATLSEVFGGLGLRPTTIGYGKEAVLEYVKEPYYNVLSEASKSSASALASVIGAISLPSYLKPETKLFEVKGWVSPSEPKPTDHIKQSESSAYRPVSHALLTSRDQLLTPLFVLAVSGISRYIKLYLQSLQESYSDYITYPEQALDVVTKPSVLGPSMVSPFIPDVLSPIESYLHSDWGLRIHEQIYSVTPGAVPYLPRSDVFDYSPVKKLTELMVGLYLPLEVSSAPYSTRLEAYPVSMHKVSAPSIAFPAFHPLRYMPVPLVEGLALTRRALDKALSSSYLVAVERLLIKQIDVVRSETPSPLIASSIEYTRTLREFRTAELEAEQEILASRSLPSLSVEKPSLTPSYFTPEVQNIFQITVPEESDLDLKELERKITRILNEQVRRYYGYLG